MNQQTEIEMSRAELRVWSLEKLGWSELRILDTTGELAGWQNEEVFTYSAPDPTRNIAEAWALKEWLRHNGSLAARKRFGQQLREELVKFADSTGGQAAEWLCCTIYWAVKGKRVVLKD